jgi:hypothetical protein
VGRDVVLYGELAYGAFRPEHREHLLDAGRELIAEMMRERVEEIRATQAARGE